MKRSIGLSLLILLASVALGFSATRYVDTTLAADCTSGNYSVAARDCSGAAGNAYNTANEATDAASCGDTIYLRSGTNTTLWRIDKNCSSNSKLTIANYQNETFTHRPTSSQQSSNMALNLSSGDHIQLLGAGTDGGQHIIIDGVNVNSGSLYFNAGGAAGGITDVLLSHLEVKNSGAGACIGMANNTVDRVTIRHSKVHTCGIGTGSWYGIYVRGSGHLIEYTEIYNSESWGLHQANAPDSTGNDDNEYRFLSIHDNGVGYSLGGGVIFAQGWRVKFHHNLIYNNVSHGIRVGSGGSGLSDTAIYANTIYSNGGRCAYFHSSSTRGIFKNNLCANNVTNSVLNESATLTQANNTTTTSASFRDAPTDFSLLAGSPALAAGTSSILSSTSGTTWTSTITQTCLGTCPTGAHDSPTALSCLVEDGDATKIRVLFNANSAMQGSAAANWTAVVAGVGVAESAVTYVSTSRVDITVPAITNGQSVTIAYTNPASNPLRDSLNIGGTRASAVRSFTAMSCTNNVGAASSATFAQVHFGWYEFYGTEADGLSLAQRGCSEDTNCVFPSFSRFILRVKVRCNTADCDPKTLNLQYSREAGAYTNIPTIPATDAISYADCPHIGDLDATTERLTSGVGGFVAGSVVSAQDTPTVDLAQDEETELAYCLGLEGATVTDTYDFRIESLDTYTVTPRATVGYSGYTVKP